MQKILARALDHFYPKLSSEERARLLKGLAKSTAFVSPNRLFTFFNDAFTDYILSLLGPLYLAAGGDVTAFMNLAYRFLLILSLSAISPTASLDLKAIKAIKENKPGNGLTIDDHNKSLANLLYAAYALTTALSIPLIILFYLSEYMLRATKQPEDVIAIAAPILQHFARLGFIPMTRGIHQQYFYALEKEPYSALFGLLARAPICLFSYAFALGKWGFPKQDSSIIGDIAVAGAAIEFFLFTQQLFRMKDKLFFSKNSFSKALFLPHLKKLAKSGVPGGAQMLVVFARNFLIAILAGREGKENLRAAEFGVLTYVGFSLGISQAFAQAATPLTAKESAHKQRDIARLFAMACIPFFAMLIIASIALREQLTSILINKNDTEAHQLAKQLLIPTFIALLANFPASLIQVEWRAQRNFLPQFLFTLIGTLIAVPVAAILVASNVGMTLSLFAALAAADTSTLILTIAAHAKGMWSAEKTTTLANEVYATPLLEKSIFATPEARAALESHRNSTVVEIPPTRSEETLATYGSLNSPA